MANIAQTPSNANGFVRLHRNRLVKAIAKSSSNNAGSYQFLSTTGVVSGIGFGRFESNWSAWVFIDKLDDPIGIGARTGYPKVHVDRPAMVVGDATGSLR